LPNESKGKLTDIITSINVVALSAANQARSWNIFKVKGVELSLAFFEQQVHLKKTASELLFEGYDDPIITVAKEIAKIMGIDVPFDRFGYFYKVRDINVLLIALFIRELPFCLTTYFLSVTRVLC
jgi:scavenger receptor class B protein 1